MGILRLLLAVAVVIAHSDSFFGFTFTGGRVAVQVFFMISGFYMAMILTRKYVGKGSYKLFISNRFLRLFPIYWATLLLTLGVSYAAYLTFGDTLRLGPWFHYGGDLSLGAVLLQVAANVLIFGQDVIMFLGVDMDTGGLYFTSNFLHSDPRYYKFLLIPQAWTLCLEMAFYLLAPFIVRKSTKFVVFLVLASVGVRLATYHLLGFSHDPWTYRFFPSELSLFLMGVLAYRLYGLWTASGFIRNNIRFAVVVVYFTCVVLFQYIPFKQYSVLRLYYMPFYLFTLVALPFIFHMTKSWKFSNRIGELSYPVYITHIFVIMCITDVIRTLGMRSFLGEAAIVLSILFSYILVRFVSDPIETIRQARVKRKPSVSPGQEALAPAGG